MFNSIYDLSLDQDKLIETVNNAINAFYTAIDTKDTGKRMATSFVFNVTSIDITTDKCLSFECCEGHRKHLMNIAKGIIVDANIASAIVTGDKPEADFIKFN